jgi:hypothetical protein
MAVTPLKTPRPFPDELRYLQPFVRWLGKQSAVALDESVDASRLERVLRKRVRGLPVVQAQQRLDADRDLLRSWLDACAPEGHPAHWVLGFLTHPDLARELLETPKAEPPQPTIHFEAPAGWQARAIPYNLNLRKGKLRAFITAINELSFHNLQVPGSRGFASGQGCVEELDIQLGEVTGKKYVRRQTAPVQARQLEYVLAVPGGFASIMLCRVGGRELDELPFEAQLPTLRIARAGITNG